MDQFKQFSSGTFHLFTLQSSQLWQAVKIAKDIVGLDACRGCIPKPFKQTLIMLRQGHLKHRNSGPAHEEHED